MAPSLFLPFGMMRKLIIMTKFTFGLLGLSMLIAAPAMASAPAMKAVKNADTLTKEVNLQTYAKPSKKAGVKKIGSAADLEGAYTWYDSRRCRFRSIFLNLGTSRNRAEGCG